MLNFLPAIITALFTIVAAVAAFLVTSPTSKMTAILVIVIVGAGFTLIMTVQQNAKDAEQQARFDEVNGRLVDLRHLVSEMVRVNQVGVAPAVASAPLPVALMDRVFPFLRFAYILQNYDGASRDRVENENRILVPSSPPVRLDYQRYVREFEADESWFNFGVANLNPETTIEDVTLTVTFEGDVTVNLTPNGTHWQNIRDNQQYRFEFGAINPQSGFNGDGLLRVQFPHRGTYTIRLAIGARNLPPKTVVLPVILE